MQYIVESYKDTNKKVHLVTECLKTAADKLLELDREPKQSISVWMNNKNILVVSLSEDDSFIVRYYSALDTGGASDVLKIVEDELEIFYHNHMSRLSDITHNKYFSFRKDSCKFKMLKTSGLKVYSNDKLTKYVYSSDDGHLFASDENMYCYKRKND